MNQLQHLLHDALLGTEHVAHAAIIRRKDFHVVAATVGFNLETPACVAIIDAFKTASKLRWMNEWMNEWMITWMNEWMNEWMNDQ